MKFLASLLLANSVFAVNMVTKFIIIRRDWSLKHIDLMDGKDSQIMKSTWKDFIKQRPCPSFRQDDCGYFEQTNKYVMVKYLS